MGECYWCSQPYCDPSGSCRDIEYCDLEGKILGKDVGAELT